MSKVQEYLKNKKIQELGLPKLYIVKSSREGVEQPVERQVVEIVESVALRGEEKLPIDRYKLEGSYPYEVDILRGDISTNERGSGSGFGDLWQWTYFSSFSKEESDKYYQEELTRVENKYLKTKVIERITNRISMSLFGIDFKVRVERDNVDPVNGRIFIQIVFNAACTKTGEPQEWHGRKWYLSEHMTNDEIVKTVYSAYKAAIEHEVMESFKVDGIILFNPHLDFEKLLEISHHETRRKA